MFLLAFHIVAIGILVVIVWAIAFRRGEKAGERRLQRRLQSHTGQESAPLPPQEGVASP
jgi:hypothetical protein